MSRKAREPPGGVKAWGGRPTIAIASAQAEVELLAQLQLVYRDADALHWDWSCPKTTDCCHFEPTGQQPYVTSIEVLAVRRAVERNRTTLEKVIAAAHGGKDRVAPGQCPLLDASGRCSVYEARPLGCRTFFCARAIAGQRVRHKDIQALVHRIEEIASRHVVDGALAQRFGRLLGI